MPTPLTPIAPNGCPAYQKMDTKKLPPYQASIPDMGAYAGSALVQSGERVVLPALPFDAYL